MRRDGEVPQGGGQRREVDAPQSQAGRRVELELGGGEVRARRRRVQKLRDGDGGGGPDARGRVVQHRARERARTASRRAWRTRKLRRGGGQQPRPERVCAARIGAGQTSDEGRGVCADSARAEPVAARGLAGGALRVARVRVRRGIRDVRVARVRGDVASARSRRVRVRGLGRSRVRAAPRRRVDAETQKPADATRQARDDGLRPPRAVPGRAQVRAPPQRGVVPARDERLFQTEPSISGHRSRSREGIAARGARAAGATRGRVVVVQETRERLADARVRALAQRARRDAARDGAERAEDATLRVLAGEQTQVRNRELNQRLRLRVWERRAESPRQRGDGVVRVRGVFFLRASRIIVVVVVVRTRHVRSRWFSAVASARTRPRQPGRVIRAQHGDHLRVWRRRARRGEVGDKRVDAARETRREFRLRRLAGAVRRAHQRHDVRAELPGVQLSRRGEPARLGVCEEAKRRVAQRVRAVSPESRRVFDRPHRVPPTHREVAPLSERGPRIARFAASKRSSRGGRVLVRGRGGGAVRAPAPHGATAERGLSVPSSAFLRRGCRGRKRCRLPNAHRTAAPPDAVDAARRESLRARCRPKKSPP